MAVAMLVVGLGIQLLLAQTAERDIGRVLQERAAAMITVVDDASDGRLGVPPDSLAPGRGRLRRRRFARRRYRSSRGSRSSVRLGRAGREQTASADGDDVRLLSAPFTTPGGVDGVMVVGAETAPYERSELYALLATVSSASSSWPARA